MLFLFKYFIGCFLKVILSLFIIVVCESCIDISNIQFKSSYSLQVNNAEILSHSIQNESLRRDEDSEVITITEPHERVSRNEIHCPNVLSESMPLSDSTDCLKRFPGFSAVRNGGTNADLVFRGMFGSRLHILDGNSEIFGACPCRMDSASAYIFPETFDIVSIIKGPQTVLWGPVTSAGVVRFERSPPIFYQSELKMRSSAMFGSYNRLDKNVDTIFGNLFGYLRLIGSMTQYHDYLDPKQYVIPSAWNKWNTNVAIGFRPCSDYLVECTISNSDGVAKYAVRGMDSISFARESVAVRLKKDSVHNGTVYNNFDWNIWHHYIHHIMDDNISHFHRLYAPKNFCSNSNAKIHNSVSRIISGIRGVLTYRWMDWQIRYGVDLQIDKHRKQMGKGYWYNDFYFQDTGLFAELDWKLTLFDKFVGGMRLEHSLIDAYLFQNKEYQQQIVIYPAGFIRYEHVFLVPVTTMYIGVGFNTRFPDYWDLVVLKSSHGIGKDFYHLINPERNIQLDMGTQLKFNKLDMWISSYFGYIRDFILYKYYDNTNCTMLNNSKCANGSHWGKNIDALIYGSEMRVSYQLDQNWNLENNVSWIFGKNMTDVSSLPQLPPLDMETILNWKFDSWNTKCIWRMVMSRTYIASDDGNIFFRDKVISKGFSVFSWNISKEISKSVNLIFGVNNLLNKMYHEHLNFITRNKKFEKFADMSIYEPGRTWWIRIGVIL